MTFRVAYAFLTAVAAACGIAFAALWTYPAPPVPPPSPYRELVEHFCQQQTEGPTERWLCIDERAHDLHNGRWHDGGPLTATPEMPAA